MCAQQISSEKNCPVSVGQGTNSSEYDGSLVGLLVLLFVIALLMITACVVFVVFAVRHPNSSTGQCLIRVSVSTCLFVIGGGRTSVGECGRLIIYNIVIVA